MTMEVALQELREAAAALEQDMHDERPRQRLRRSVIRPLDHALAHLTGSEGPSSDPPPAPVGDTETGASVADRALDLARRATRLRVEHGDGLALEAIEAVAGLQDLAVALAPDDAGPRRATLAGLQASLPSTIHTEADGPYLVTNPDRLRSWLGVDIPTMPQMALCRCGQSASKPLCDGTHADIGFTDAKDPGRVPDRLDTYVGLRVTVHDNRGTCAHSGLCTDRVPTVFQRKADAFVAPSGGRMDEIMRAVRACPSGALSVELAEQAAQNLVDQDREPAIEVSRDGPYRITGGIPLLDAQRNPVARNAGASLEHYSLCRCGHSQNKPFCSGMHWYAAFQDPPLGDEPTLFEWAGGFTALRRMTHIFYETHVPEDPLLAPLFANMSPDHPERVAAWLGETFGGPKLHTEMYGGYDRMVSQHLGKALTEAQRARWASLMIQSADEAGLPTDPEFRAAFVAYLEWGTRIAVENSTPGAKPPEHMPVPGWWWVCDATPGSRVSALASDRATGDEDVQPVVLPGSDVDPSFQAHIKPLFRTKDRQAMRFAFDLWSHEDVSQHADAILARLTAGSMPCDGAWPAERITVFERWIAAGVPP
jgi:CDGSH-type Zn-finger protein/truncated hemoglobin YjbI/ferredoxin